MASIETEDEAAVSLCRSQDSNNSNNTDSQTSQSSHNSKSYRKLKSAAEKSVKRVTSKTRVLPYIKERFRKVYDVDNKNFLDLYVSMMNQLESMMKEEFQDQLDARNVGELLGNLDTIKAKFTDSERKWRPSGLPREDIKAHIQEASQIEVEKLKKVLKSLETQNHFFNECAQKADDKLDKSIKNLEKYCSSWNQAADVLTDEAKQELIKVNMDQSEYPNICEQQSCGPGRT